MAVVAGAFNSAILSGGSLLPTVFELLAQEALTGALRTASEYILKVSLGCMLRKFFYEHSPMSIEC